MTTGTSWDRLRKMIAARDGERCVYCGALTPDGAADHVLPLSKGGTDGIDNLVWTCQSCNSSKQDKTLREWIKARLDVTSYDVDAPETPAAPRKWNKRWRTYPDYKAQGFECDCGGYGYMAGFAQWRTYPKGYHHGHHHPDCPLLVYYEMTTDPGYSPKLSKIVNGKVELHRDPSAYADTPDAEYRAFEQWFNQARRHILKDKREKMLRAEIEYNKRHPYTGVFVMETRARKTELSDLVTLWAIYPAGDGSETTFVREVIEAGYEYLGDIAEHPDAMSLDYKEWLYLALYPLIKTLEDIKWPNWGFSGLINTDE